MAPLATRPRRLLVAALAALALATTQSTAAGLSPVDVGGDTIVVPAVAAPDTDTARFVSLWDGRFRSGEAFQAYLDSDVVYDDGYNALSPDEQARLVRALVEHWRTSDTGFAEHVDWEPADPADPNDPDTGEEDARPNVEQVLATVDAIVFHKEEFKQQLRQPDEGGDAGKPAPPAATEPTPADGLAEQAAAELTAAADAAALTPGLGALDALDSDTTGLPERVVEVVPVDAVDRLPTTGDVAGVELGDVGDALAPLLDALPRIDTSTERTSAAAYAPAAIGPQNLTYAICWQLPSQAANCPSTTYLVGLLVAVPGTAALIDVDNNVLTGLAGFDLEISLTIDPLTTPGGLAATVAVKRHSAVAANARGIVRYVLPDSDKEVRVGFDGRSVGLQPQQTATVLFESIAGMSTGDARIRASVAHTGTPGGPSVALETSYAGGVTPDSLATLTTFDRAPAAFTARLAQRRTPAAQITQVETTHGSANLPDVTVDAVARLGSSRLVGHVVLTRVPTSASVTATADDTTDATRVTYTASSQLQNLSAAVSLVPDVAVPGTFGVAAMSLANLPTTFTADVGTAALSYTANTAGGGLQASLDLYTSALLKKRAYVGLSSTPSSVSATLAAGAQRYVVDSGSGIAAVTAGYLDTNQRLNASVVVTGFPGHAELTMPSGTDARIAWTASSATSSVLVMATYGAWTGHLEVTNVPRSMSIVPGTANVDVTATGGTGASIFAWLTNYNSYTTSPYTGDNFVTANRAKLVLPAPGGSGTTTLSLVSAAVRVQNLVRLRIVPGATTTVDLEAGGGAALYARYSNDDYQARTRKLAEARLVSFPGSVHAAIGATTTIDVNTNTDLTAYVEVGPLVTALPAMPSVHGVVVRRTAQSGGPLTRVKVWLTGLPTHVSIAPGSIILGGLRPSVSSLTVDVALTDDPVNPITAYASLTGIPTGTPHGITVTWTTAPYGTGYRTIVSASTSGATFGALAVAASYGRYGASLSTSALPSSMTTTVTEAEGVTTFAWSASASIASLTATGVARPSPTSSWSARATVSLTDLPSSFTLTTGRDGAGSGPLVSYTAVPSPRLDATVVADGSLKTSSTSVNANLFFRLVDLAPGVSVSKVGNGFQLISSGGRTATIEARVSAKAGYTKQDSGVANQASWLQFPWSYKLQISGVLDNLNVVLSNVATFTVKPDVTTELSGDFGTFHLRYDSFVVNVTAQGKLEALFDIWVCQCRFTIVNAAVATQFNINPVVRLYAPGFHDILNASIQFICWRVGFRAQMQPTAFAMTTFTAGINLTGLPGSGRTYWATPVAFGWTTVSDVVTGRVLYGSAFAKGWFTSTWTCW